MLPNLIHPINIVIHPIDKTATTYDADAREPIGPTVYKTPVTVPAQAQWRNAMDPKWQAIGPVEDTRGYLLFRYVDLTATGYTPRRGDMIRKIGHVDTMQFLTQTEDAGHYPDQNGATLRRAFFGDRRPSVVEPEM